MRNYLSQLQVKFIKRVTTFNGAWRNYMHIIIEQTINYPKRMQYDPTTDTFSETAWDSLLYARGVSFPYGWLKSLWKNLINMASIFYFAIFGNYYISKNMV